MNPCGFIHDSEFFKFLDEAMGLELLVADLYTQFSRLFHEDSEFWWKLAIEEKNHGALVRGVIENLLPADILPIKITSLTIASLRDSRKKVQTILDETMKSPPSREMAFNLALEIEASAGEIHFQNAMEAVPDSKAMALFQKLNQDDKDHISRIRYYMGVNNIREIALDSGQGNCANYL